MHRQGHYESFSNKIYSIDSRVNVASTSSSSILLKVRKGVLNLFSTKKLKYNTKASRIKGIPQNKTQLKTKKRFLWRKES